MIRRFFIYLCLIFSLVAVTLACLFGVGLSFLAVPFSVGELPPRMTILLIPLDSRPPCTSYVESLAHMAGMKVILPPSDLLDEYRRPGNVAGLQEWLQRNIYRADAAIVSVDMLTYGGLLTSRQGTGTAGAIEKTLALLSYVHETHPRVKVYAFNIIPRLLIADDVRTEKYKQPMADWSMLQDTVSLFENPRDVARLQELETLIPADIRDHYRSLYAANSHLNQQLWGLAQKGVLAGLVLGQDDSAPFGLGNLERRRLDNALASHPDLSNRLFITRGTDEVAISLLGKVAASAENPGHKVYIHFTEEHAADTIMPYMPGPLFQTIDEKLALAGAQVTDSIPSADYILVIHAGNPHSQPKRLTAEANRIKAWVQAGRSVALVDLAKDWRADQTLLPYLRRNGTPVYQLVAYAGWNTASNSIGTAVTQASMVLLGRVRAPEQAAVSRETARLGFLAARLLDDWYYQKVYRPVLNADLQKRGINPYDLQQAQEAVTLQVNHHLYNAWLQLVYWDWRNATWSLPPDKKPSYAIAGWKLHSGLPWDRTFEIFVEATPAPARIISQ